MFTVTVECDSLEEAIASQMNLSIITTVMNRRTCFLSRLEVDDVDVRLLLFLNSTEMTHKESIDWL